jgi:hypothetical protein
MYNWYPIFNTLSLSEVFRIVLNKKCYETIRLLEQGYLWYPIKPYQTEDELGITLNGNALFRVEST